MTAADWRELISGKGCIMHGVQFVDALAHCDQCGFSVLCRFAVNERLLQNGHVLGAQRRDFINGQVFQNHASAIEDRKIIWHWSVLWLGEVSPVQWTGKTGGPHTLVEDKRPAADGRHPC